MSTLRSESSAKSSSTPTIESMFRRQTQSDGVSIGRDVSVVQGIEQHAENVTSETNLDKLTKTMDSRDNETDCNSAFRCPVCNKHLQDDIALVNSHIDECLARASSSSQRTISLGPVDFCGELQNTSSTEPAEPHDTCSSSVTEQLHEPREQLNEPREKDDLNSTGSGERVQSLKQCQFSSPSVSKRQYNETVDDLKDCSSSEEPFYCPVCNLPQPTVMHDVKLINQHIDECLNRELLDNDQTSKLLPNEIRFVLLQFELILR